MVNDGDERRKAERVSVNSEFEQLGQEHITYVSDLSETGVFVHTTERPPLGSTVELQFTVLLDDPVVIKGLGKVRRHQPARDEGPGGIGVQFGPLSPIMVLRIQDVLSRQRPRDAGEPLPTLGAALAGASASGLSARVGAAADSGAFESAVTGRFERVPPQASGESSGVDIVVEDDDDDVTRAYPAVDAEIPDDE